MKITPYLTLFFAIIMFSFSTVSSAGVDTSTDENAVILAGHDAVAYFVDNKAVLGKPSFTAVHNDAIYRFSSAKNRDTFVKTPEKYAPAYGGYCAYATSFGKKVSVNGRAFKIVNERLYVNRNLAIHDDWLKDISQYIENADDEWSDIKDSVVDTL